MKKEFEKPQRNNRPWLSWYKTAAWTRLRLWQLKRDPLCHFCRKMGIITAANTVDHITPHRGNKELFFDRSNLQSLCKTCHSSIKQKMEKTGDYGGGVDGMVKAWKD